MTCYAYITRYTGYEDYIPFEEVMARLSYYMADETVFEVKKIGIDYRMFTEMENEKTYYNWIPYWSFLVENPNDGTKIRVYINIETGDIESYQI